MLTHTTHAYNRGGWEQQHYNVTAYGRVAASFAEHHLPGQVIVITGEVEVQLQDTLIGVLPQVSIVAHRIITVDGPLTPPPRPPHPPSPPPSCSTRRSDRSRPPERDLRDVLAAALGRVSTLHTRLCPQVPAGHGPSATAVIVRRTGHSRLVPDLYPHMAEPVCQRCGAPAECDHLGRELGQLAA